MAAGAIVATALAVLVPGAYAADTFEPNDTRETATTLLLDVPRSSYLFTSGDEDFYRVVTPRAGHLRITLDVPDGVDYSLSVSSTFNTVESNLGSGLDEEVFLSTVRPAGTSGRAQAKQGLRDRSRLADRGRGRRDSSVARPLSWTGLTATTKSLNRRSEDQEFLFS